MVVEILKRKNVYLLHKRIDSLQRAFINSLELCGALFMMDGCTFLSFKISNPIHHQYNTFVFVWKKKVIYT